MDSIGAPSAGRPPRWRASRRRFLAGAALPLVPALAGACASPVRAAFNGGVLDTPVPLPSLGLQRAAGGRFDTAQTGGRVSLFFFGYTSCPDICPLTLAYVTQVRQRLGARAKDVDAYFVTVDPERDTPARLQEYIANFDTAIVPLTGTDQELARARAAFGVVAEKRPLPDSAAGYAMDHTAVIYLVDQHSQIRLIYPHGMKPADIAPDVLKVLGGR